MQGLKTPENDLSDSFLLNLNEDGTHTSGFMPGLDIIGPDSRPDMGAQQFYTILKKLEAAAGTWMAQVILLS